MLSFNQILADPEPSALFRRKPPVDWVSPAYDCTPHNALGKMARAIAEQVEADGLLIARHAPGCDVQIVFASGTCEANNRATRQAIDVARGAAGIDATRGALSTSLYDDAAITLRIDAAGDLVTLTTLHGPIDQAQRARYRQRLSASAAMLEAFFALLWTRDHALDQLHELQRALDRSDVATILVDRRCRIRFANAVAHTLLDSRDAICANGDILSAARLADTMRLQAAITHVCSHEDGHAAQAPVVAVHREKGRPLLAAVVRGEAHSSTDDAKKGAAIVYLFDPERDLAPLIEPACNLYRLSPMEAKLACLIADGASLSDAAKRLRVREQTARSYLKQIFLKTDTKRQAELVWLLLKSSVRTAPNCITRFV